MSRQELVGNPITSIVQNILDNNFLKQKDFPNMADLKKRIAEKLTQKVKNEQETIKERNFLEEAFREELEK